MFAIPVSKATGIDVNILIAVSGLLMTMTIFFGISALTILSIIAVPAIVILGSYSVWLAVDGVGGLDHFKAMVPQTPLNFSGALALVVGSFISEHLDNQRQRALCVGSGLCQRDRPFQPHAVGG